MNEQNHSNGTNNTRGSAACSPGTRFQRPQRAESATWGDGGIEKSNNVVATYPGNVDLQSMQCNSGGLGVSIQSATPTSHRTGKTPRGLPSPQSKMSSKQNLSLRQWIQQTLHTIGNQNSSDTTCPATDTRPATSPLYLECCIKIAIPLTQQIIQAEKLARYGINDKLAMLPIQNHVDWAKYTRITLRQEDDVGYQETMPGIDLSDTATSGSDAEQAVANSRPESHSNQEPSINYFNIDSAQIKCPESSLRNYVGNDNTQREKLQRIFYLALLFYELFSGGELPASNTFALATFDGAFVSLPTLTLAEEIENDENAFKEPKRHQGPAGTGRRISLCKLCFEQLKFMGIPGPICHLIFNMMESVYGDLSGEESYNEMSAITFDLQLMLSRPKFLYGLNMNQLSSSSCLQFDNNSMMREEEFQSIQSSYQRCQSGSSELAIIKGESGSGKTWLAHRVGNSIIEDGGLFLVGKFDQLQQQRPFAALASAFDQYCDILISQKNSDWAIAIVKNLRSTFGLDITYLINIIPKLGQIIDGITFDSVSSDHDNDSGNIMQRIKYLLCQFVEIINTDSIASITLFLDDLQWADEASIAVIERLVTTQARKKFFFLGCCRDDEMDNDHLFWKVIEGAHANGINVVTSHTKCLTEDALNGLISDFLCLSPRIVKSLSSIVYNKTKGNFLFISQLLLSLSRDGMLRIDLGMQRWVWDQDKIFMAKLPDNVAICFTNGIKKLPIEVQLALHTLSLFGARAKSDCIKTLESDLKVKIAEPLKKAAAEGLVNEIDGSFQFCHDRIQEASYQIIQEYERRCNHLTYGQCLVKRALEIGDDEMLFIALNQINFGGPSVVTHKAEYYIMANHNLTAARKATTMSDFHTAYSFCENGISFLRKDHWRDHYEFSLELFDLASRCALAIGNVEGLHFLSNNVLKNARCFEHKLNVHFCNISSQALTSKTSDALDMGLEIVSQLGEDIPRRPSQLMLDQHMQITFTIISGVTQENLLNYRVMSDVKKLAAMRFLTKLQNVAFFVNQILHSYIILKMVQITVSFGKQYVSDRKFHLLWLENSFNSHICHKN